MSSRPDPSRAVQPDDCLSVQSGGSMTPDGWTDAADGRGERVVPQSIDHAEDDSLRPCEHPACGFFVRWWFRHCPTHRRKENSDD